MKTIRGLFAFLLVLTLFLALSVPAFAASAQYTTTQEFLKVLKREKNTYNYMGIDEDDDEEVRVTFSGDNLDEIPVEIFFDEDLDAVSMRSWQVIYFDKKDLADVLTLVNDLNSQYKFVKFVVDPEDESVDAEIDVPLREGENAGELAYDALYYIVIIVDEAYPQLAKFEA